MVRVELANKPENRGRSRERATGRQWSFCISVQEEKNGCRSLERSRVCCGRELADGKVVQTRASWTRFNVEM